MQEVVHQVRVDCRRGRRPAGSSGASASWIAPAELADRLRQPAGEVRHLHPRAGSPAPAALACACTGSSFSTCCHSKLTLAAGHVEALAVLPGAVEQAAASPPRTTSRALDLERRGLDRERAVVLRDQLLADAPGAVAHDALGQRRLARLRSGSPGTATTQCVAYHIGGSPGQ